MLLALNWLAAIVAERTPRWTLNFHCHTPITLIVQNKWANFWSSIFICGRDRGNFADWLGAFVRACVCGGCACTCVRNHSTHNLSEGLCLLCLCYSLRALLWPLLISIRLPLIARRGRERGWVGVRGGMECVFVEWGGREVVDGWRERRSERERLFVRLCMWAVWASPWIQCWVSRLIICIFSFELLFAALRAAAALQGPAE